MESLTVKKDDIIATKDKARLTYQCIEVDDKFITLQSVDNNDVVKYPNDALNRSCWENITENTKSNND